VLDLSLQLDNHPVPHLQRANDLENQRPNLPLSPVAAAERSEVINANGYNWLKEHRPRWDMCILYQNAQSRRDRSSQGQDQEQARPAPKTGLVLAGAAALAIRSIASLTQARTCARHDHLRHDLLGKITDNRPAPSTASCLVALDKILDANNPALLSTATLHSLELASVLLRRR
jgi:hypothetical protein